MDWIAIIPIVIALLLIGFFSGIEVVFISANKLSIELRKKQGNYSGKTWSLFLETPARFIITILIISNILLAIYALLASCSVRFNMAILVDRKSLYNSWCRNYYCYNHPGFFSIHFKIYFAGQGQFCYDKQFY